MATKTYLDNSGTTTAADKIYDTFATKAAVAAEETARQTADEALETRIETLEDGFVENVTATFSNRTVQLSVTTNGVANAVKFPYAGIYRNITQNDTSDTAGMYRHVKKCYANATDPVVDEFVAWIPHEFVKDAEYNPQAGSLSYTTTTYTMNTTDPSPTGTFMPTTAKKTFNITNIANFGFRTLKKIDEAKKTGTYVVEDGETMAKILPWMDMNIEGISSFDDFDFAFDFSNVTNFDSMFENMRILDELPADIDTSKGVSFVNAFYRCEYLEDASKVDLSNATTIAFAFSSCNMLATPPATMNTSKCTDFAYAFYGCANITTMPNINISGITDRANIVSDRFGVNPLYGMLMSTRRLTAVTFAHDTYYDNYTSSELTNMNKALTSSQSSNYKTISFVQA